jgi:hypothetical protein
MQAQLPRHKRTLREFDWMRQKRNDTQYPDPGKPTATANDVTDGIAAAQRIVELGERFLERHRPAEDRAGALVNRDGAAAWLRRVLFWGSGWWPAGAAGAGDADAAALIGGVAEAVSVAGFEFGEPVEAFGGGVGDAGEHGGDDLVFPAGDGAGEGLEFGDVLVGGAPVAEGKEPVADLPLARR